MPKDRRRVSPTCGIQASSISPLTKSRTLLSCTWHEQPTEDFNGRCTEEREDTDLSYRIRRLLLVELRLCARTGAPCSHRLWINRPSAENAEVPHDGYRGGNQ